MICSGRRAAGLKCGFLLSQIPVPADHVSAGKVSDGLCPDCYAIELGKAQVTYIDHGDATAPTHCVECTVPLLPDLTCPKCGVAHSDPCAVCLQHGFHHPECSPELEEMLR